MNRALVVIDVQESFRAGPPGRWSATPASPATSNASSTPPVPPATSWSGCCTANRAPAPSSTRPAVMSASSTGSKPLDGEPILTKTSRNAFTTTNLQQILTERGIRDLVICGIQTEQCCETTARLAADLGYDVTFVIDATATFPIAHRDAPAPDRGGAGRPT